MKPKTMKCPYEFDILIPCSATYFLEVDARISLKVATKSFLEIKETMKT